MLGKCICLLKITLFFFFTVRLCCYWEKYCENVHEQCYKAHNEEWEDILTYDPGFVSLVEGYVLGQHSPQLDVEVGHGKDNFCVIVFPLIFSETVFLKS